MLRRKKWQPTREKLTYPKWTYVYNIDSKKYYLILNKTKKEFISNKAFSSWSVSAIQGTNESISHYPTYGKIAFRPGTVIRSMANTFFYVETEDTIREITDPDFFLVMGFTTRSALIVSQKEIDFYQKGEDIDGIYL